MRLRWGGQPAGDTGLTIVVSPGVGVPLLCLLSWLCAHQEPRDQSPDFATAPGPPPPPGAGGRARTGPGGTVGGGPPGAAGPEPFLGSGTAPPPPVLRWAQSAYGNVLYIVDSRPTVGNKHSFPLASCPSPRLFDLHEARRPGAEGPSSQTQTPDFKIICVFKTCSRKRPSNVTHTHFWSCCRPQTLVIVVCSGS